MRCRLATLTAGVALLLLGGWARGEPPAPARAPGFERDVLPLLASHCLKCHGGDARKGGLDLRTPGSMLEGGKHGPVLVKGSPDKSPLVARVTKQEMPPGKDKLTDAQVALLRDWINAGAPSERGDAGPTWAFRPVARPAVPAVQHPDRVRTPLDAFVLARLEREGFTLAPEADPATLIRRVSFDLVGLPPSPEEVEAFVNDTRPDAYERLVERLLASPHYGERWGRHWLDVARFGESQGYERDKLRDHSWPYRDYVVGSFNDDKPYDRLVKEQIAGDVLDPAPEDGVVATGFLVAGPWDEVGQTQQGAVMRQRVREEELEEMLAAVGQTFLGLSVNCARCHDHKFDPIPTKDYYRLKASLEGVHAGDRPALVPARLREHEAKVAEANRRIAELEKEVAGLEAAGREKVLREQGKPDAGKLPSPVARWTFEKDAKDSVGGLHGSLQHGAVIANGRLRLDGKGAFVQTEPLAGDLREKTLEAWVVLPELDQRGGGVVSVQTNDGSVFDAIVFGEREPKKWLAGSSGFQRSRDLEAVQETAGAQELVHVAIVYAADDSVTVYRNGVAYGAAYVPKGDNATLRSYPARESRVLFGLRHTGAGNGYFHGEIEEARLYDRALGAAEVAASFRAGPERVPLEEVLKALGKEQRERHASLTAELARQRAAVPALPAELTYGATPSTPEPTFILPRGDVEKPGEQVTAGALSAVKGLDADFGLPADGPEGPRRVKLAEWVASADNPLTPRVLVNRVWHYHFGRGLVGTPNDFGLNGEPPSHPELLDWLAAEFTAGGGSLKRLHRLILLSSVYRQAAAFNAKAAALDGDDRWLWRFAPRRLEGEAVRDAMLSVSGNLNHQLGGPSFRPFTVSVFNSTFYTLTDPVGPEFNRRTVYRMNVNSARSPLLEGLDCPDPSQKTPRRAVTTTPLQALGLMNDSFVLRQARGFAERVRREAGEDAAGQVARAYRLALARPPTDEEAKRATAVAREHGLETVCWALLNASEFLHVK
jgi:mono/diheme cytochrome c family protein